MKYVVAVSGGVDSVVLLDMLVKKAEHELVVAHFDHGIRDDSAADARFVGALAEKYHLPFETTREELGKNASEELARERRYAFLRDVAKKYNAKIVTAHHADDAVETIALNLQRGTGWRGLACLDTEDIERPLLDKTKAEIYDYALAHQLEWVEDETNLTPDYTRNRLRRVLHGQLEMAAKQQLLALRNQQLQQKQLIDASIEDALTDENEQSRYFFTYIDREVALELLRSVLLRCGRSATRPQRMRMLHAIKTARPGGVLQVGQGIEVTFTVKSFIVKHPL